MSNAEIEKLRSILAGAQSFTADTVIALDRILKLPLSERNNASPKMEPAKKATRPNTKSGRPPKEKPPPKAITQSSPTTTSLLKQQQALATDVVNRTLKALTEAAKVVASARKDASQTTSSTRPIAKDAKYLSYVARCARIATGFLSQTRRPSESQDANQQLGQGMIVLIGRLLVLDLHDEAVKQLHCLRSHIGVAQNPRDSKPSTETPLLETMVAIKPKAPTLSLVKLCVTYQGLVIQMIDRIGSSGAVAAACSSLDPLSDSSPYATIVLYNSLSSSAEESEKMLEAHVKLLQTLARPIKSRFKLSPASILQLELFAMWIRGQSGTPLSSVSLYLAVMTFLKTSGQPNSKKLELVTDLMERLYPGAIGQDPELDGLLGALANSVGNHSCTGTILSTQEAVDNTQTSTVDLDQNLQALKESKKVTAILLETLHLGLSEAVQSLELSTSSINQVIEIQTVLTKRTVATQRCSDTGVEKYLCECFLKCLEYWKLYLSRDHTDGTQSSTVKVQLSRIMDPAILAINSLLTTDQGMKSIRALKSAHETQQVIFEAIRRSLADIKATTLIALSNMQWKTYQKLRKTPCANDKLVREAIVASINTLRISTLSVEDRDLGHYVDKLCALISLDLDMASSSSFVDSPGVIADARTSILRLIRHLSRNMFFDCWTPEVSHSPESKGHSEKRLEAIVSAMILFTLVSKESLLGIIAEILPQEQAAIIFNAWLSASKDNGRRVIRDEVQFCLTTLLQYSEEWTATDRLSLCSQILVHELSYSDSLSASLVASTITKAQQAEVDLPAKSNSYVQMLRASWSLAKSMLQITSGHDSFHECLSSLSVAIELPKKTDISLGAQPIVMLLLLAYDYFHIRGWQDLQGKALQISDVLIESSTTLSPSQVQHVQLLKVRHSIACNMLDSALRLLDEISIKATTSEVPTQVRALKVLVELEVACSTTDAAKIRNSVAACVTLMAGKDCSKQDKLLLYKLEADVGLMLSEYLLAHGKATQTVQLLRATGRLIKSFSNPGRRGKRGDNHALEDATQAFQDLTLTCRSSGDDCNGYPALALCDIHTSAAVIRCTLLQAQASIQLGLRQEAARHLRNVKRLMSDLDVQSLNHLAQTDILRFETLIQDRADDRIPSEVLIDQISPAIPTTPLLLLLIALGDWHLQFDSVASALAKYRTAESIAQPRPMRSSSAAAGTALDELERALGVTKTSGGPKKKTRTVPNIKPKTSTFGQRKQTAAPRREERIARTVQELPQRTHQLLNLILRQIAIAHLKGNDLQQARLTLASIDMAREPTADTSRTLVRARLEMAHAEQMIERDVTFATLPESTLSIPACGRIPPDPMEETSLTSSADLSDDTRELLNDSKQLQKSLELARSLVARGTGAALASCPVNVAYRLMHLAARSTITLSAVNENSAGQLHPCTLAWTLEVAANEATRRHQAHVAQDRRPIEQGGALQSFHMDGQSTALDTVGRFQHDYVDSLPSHWTTVSVLMNEDATELWLCRYHSGELPFILRLPMSRKSEEQFDDAEPFTHKAAHEELMNIIRLSDLSCHNPPDPAANRGKSGWWEEREELDRRLGGLLKSMEDMWLGGFKSIFSLHNRRPDLLARFRKSFDSILDRHLPSRQGKQTKKNRPILHSHILDLFVGLDAGPEAEKNLDDDVMDILFFVVDTLRWNGEANAHDEVDFDAMTIETIDALQSYHEAAGTTDSKDTSDKHLILRLDKRLHLFPWESLPCLQNKSITRVASLVQLKDRVLTMRHVSSLDLDRYHVARKKGTALLNPSSDLFRTEATLSPQLTLLKEQHDWSVHTQHKPSQPDFVSFLEQSNTLLYFGHGSGTQYIGERSIQRLKKCADVVWLMGCSSGKVQTWGELESESVPLSYLLAGEEVDCDAAKDLAHATKRRQGMCMSVVATLWDVTDRDIDNFSMSVGKKWGLFGERKTPTEGAKRGNGMMEESAIPKTPARTGRAPKTPAKTPKTPGKTATKVPKRNTKKKTVEIPDDEDEQGEKMSLAAAVARSRDVCYLRYLNGAASVVYGIPTYLGD